MKLTIEHELNESEKREFIQSLSIDELFDLIKWNTGLHSCGFDEDWLIERILDDYPVVKKTDIGKILEELPDLKGCKTAVEALAVEELNLLV